MSTLAYKGWEESRWCGLRNAIENRRQPFGCSNGNAFILSHRTGIAGPVSLKSQREEEVDEQLRQKCRVAEPAPPDASLTRRNQNPMGN